MFFSVYMISLDLTQFYYTHNGEQRILTGRLKKLKIYFKYNRPVAIYIIYWLWAVYITFTLYDNTACECVNTERGCR